MLKHRRQSVLSLTEKEKQRERERGVSAFPNENSSTDGKTFQRKEDMNDDRMAHKQRKGREQDQALRALLASRSLALGTSTVWSTSTLKILPSGSR